jgi:hypothetical protein
MPHRAQGSHPGLQPEVVREQESTICSRPPCSQDPWVVVRASCGPGAVVVRRLGRHANRARCGIAGLPRQDRRVTFADCDEVGVLVDLCLVRDGQDQAHEVGERRACRGPSEDRRRDRRSSSRRFDGGHRISAARRLLDTRLDRLGFWSIPCNEEEERCGLQRRASIVTRTVCIADGSVWRPSSRATAEIFRASSTSRSLIPM